MRLWKSDGPLQKMPRYEELGEMQCIIRRIDVLSNGTVRMLLYPLHCPDMTQAINLATWLCPLCDRIEAASGGNDTLYVRFGNQWEARIEGKFDWYEWVDA
jgi:hypothetical protein